MMMKILNDSEHRIFLSAMSRERKVCENEDFWDYDGTNKLLDICDSIERKINDAESVRHGHWEHDETGANFCSVCNEYPYDDGEYHLVWHTDYCPICGADMRGTEDE